MDSPAADLAGQVLQQRTLADTCLATENQHSTGSNDVSDEPVELHALTTPPNRLLIVVPQTAGSVTNYGALPTVSRREKGRRPHAGNSGRGSPNS
jgi:hypothetical protein